MASGFTTSCLRLEVGGTFFFCSPLTLGRAPLDPAPVEGPPPTERTPDHQTHWCSCRSEKSETLQSSARVGDREDCFSRLEEKHFILRNNEQIDLHVHVQCHACTIIMHASMHASAARPADVINRDRERRLYGNE